MIGFGARSDLSRFLQQTVREESGMVLDSPKTSGRKSEEWTKEGWFGFPPAMNLHRDMRFVDIE